MERTEHIILFIFTLNNNNIIKLIIFSLFIYQHHSAWQSVSQSFKPKNTGILFIFFRDCTQSITQYYTMPIIK